ncbi:MAG: fluoride efflux transporter CrcB [Candidatus Omnitrophica bacterium]|nr:fluoride efflux transporter CrcB [Candidatus Omnitrophota bacterium]MDD5501779.1 fluoride efflux transporter CrcB [Candidatus Omnitrophota bacterium]
MTKFINLVIGGAAGTAARYLLSGFVYRVAGTSFPYGTMAVNVCGCFILGLLASLSEKKFVLSPDARMLLMIGFCGAFTTFSTFIFETDTLLRSGQIMRASLNLFASLVFGLILFRAGSYLGEII